MVPELRKFCESKHMTQRDLAARLGITEEHLSRALNGKMPITDSLIGKFFLAFGPDETVSVFGALVVQEVPAEDMLAELCDGAAGAVARPEPCAAGGALMPDEVPA